MVRGLGLSPFPAPSSALSGLPQAREEVCGGQEQLERALKNLEFYFPLFMHIWLFAQKLISIGCFCNFKSNVKKNKTQEVWLILSLIQPRFPGSCGYQALCWLL